MKVVYNKKPNAIISAIARGTLVMVECGESKKPILCMVISSSSMDDIIKAYIDSDFDFFDTTRTPVVEIETGIIHLLPDNTPCVTISDYNLTVNNL